MTYMVQVLCICATLLLGCLSHATAQIDADSLFSRAKVALNEKERDSAVHYAQLALEVSEKDTLTGKLEHFIGYVLANRYKYDEAIPHLMEAIHILEPTGQFEGIVADAYLKTGASSRDPEVKHAMTSEAIKRFTALNDSLNVAAACLNLGNLCFRQGQIEKFRLMGADGLNWLGSADRSDLRTRLNFAQGRYYNATGNFETALLFFERAYEELVATSPRDPFIFNVCKDYGLLLSDLGYYDKAIEVLKKPILPDSESKSPHRFFAEAGLWFDLGKVYMDAGRYTFAEDAYNMSAKSIQPYYGDQHVFTAYPYSELINLYLLVGDTTRAVSSAETALDILDGQQVYKHPDYARMSQRMHAGLVGLGWYDKALERVNAGMESLGYSDTSGMVLNEVYRYDILIDLMNRKTDLYASQTKDQEKVTRHYYYHIDLLDTIQLRQIDPATRIRILEENYHVFEKAIAHVYDQYKRNGDSQYAREILSLSERSKDQLYTRFLLQNTVRSRYDIPQELLDEEQRLNSDLANIELELYTQLDADTNRSAALDDRAKEIKLELLKVQNAINYPIDTRDIATNVNRDVRPDPAVNLLHIFNGSEADYLICHSRGKYNITRVNNENNLDDFADALRVPNDNWLPSGYEVYEMLAPALSIIDMERPLLIVPDGGWSHIPFEALPVEAAQKGEMPTLLLEKVEISYASSLRAMHLEDNREPANKPLAAYAPTYEMNVSIEDDSTGSELYAQLVRSGEYALPGASREAEVVSNTLGGDRYTGLDATEDHFRKHAHEFQILHLSMHALLEDENPNYSRLIFTQTDNSSYDNYLYASELSRMSLNADLAVLSACNTGRGRNVKGEGVMSLSRAFNYAGVPSVVHSLWKVPDDATADIMPAFYVGLKEGNTKSSALRAAKLEYLSTTIAPEQKHPFYWAGFVATGDVTPVALSQSNLTHYVVIGLIALAVLFILGARTARKRRISA